MNNPEIEKFIKAYVEELHSGSAAVFAGAGLSKNAGYVDWKGLLTEIAEDLGLKIDIEYDLISLAQYHINENSNNHKIIQKLVNEFNTDTKITPNHKILASLPISTYWTTNYDKLIEESLKDQKKIFDVKYTKNHLSISKNKKDATVYKMHGDIENAHDAILTKKQYESYYFSHEYFITALKGDLLSKTFLFIGFSFSDPNIDYVLSRLNTVYEGNMRQHYCFIKKVDINDVEDESKADLAYLTRKQQLAIGELKRHGIKAILVDTYTQITDILEDIAKRYKKKTVFISGSAENYGEYFPKQNAENFIHILAKKIIEKDFSIVNGFGWGIGSAVLNGALDAVHSNQTKYTEEQIILKPFPQFATGNKTLTELNEEYRQKMIAMAGTIIVIFGNKTENNHIVNAKGVLREYEIAKKQGLILLPLGATGFASEQLWTELINDFESLYPDFIQHKSKFNELGNKDLLANDYNSYVENLVQLLLILTK